MIITPVVCSPTTITHATVCASEQIYNEHIQLGWTDGFTFWTETRNWSSGSDFCPEIFYTGIWKKQGVQWQQVEIPWALWLSDLQGDFCG